MKLQTEVDACKQRLSRCGNADLIPASGEGLLALSSSIDNHTGLSHNLQHKRRSGSEVPSMASMSRRRCSGPSKRNRMPFAGSVRTTGSVTGCVGEYTRSSLGKRWGSALRRVRTSWRVAPRTLGQTCQRLPCQAAEETRQILTEESQRPARKELRGEEGHGGLVDG